MKYQMAAMRHHGGGSIVNNSSMNGLVAIENAAEYVSAKHAVCGLTRGASSEARKTGVRVNAVLPGLIETPMIKRLAGEPGFEDHLAGALVRWCAGALVRWFGIPLAASARLRMLPVPCTGCFRTSPRSSKAQ